MKADYLGDRTGEPDPEVERLEKLLGGYRHQSKRPGPLLEQQVKLARRPFGRVPFESTVFKYAAAAVMLIALGVFAWLVVPRDLPEAKRISDARLPDLVEIPQQWMIDTRPPDNLAPATYAKEP